MTTDAYITTTGERWTLDERGYVWHASKRHHIDDPKVFAELRAMRAQRDASIANFEGLAAAFQALEKQRDELLALVRRAAEDSCVTTSDDPGCFFCDWSEHRDDCPAKPFLEESGE